MSATKMIKKINPLCVLPPKMHGHVKKLKMERPCFFNEDEKLLVMKYGAKVTLKARKKIDSDPVFDDKYLKTNIKLFNKFLQSPQILIMLIIVIIIIRCLNKYLSALVCNNNRFYFQIKSGKTIFHRHF